jgi:hypothetical protein
VVVGLVQVLHDHVEVLTRIAGTEPPEGVEQVWQPLALAEDAAEAVAVDVGEAEELLGAFEAAI